MSLVLLAERLRVGELSPREAANACLERIERLNPHLNAFITLRAEEALAEADSAPRGALYGVPLAVKDVIDVAGMPTTAASKILAGNVPRRDAECVRRLRAAGAVVVGKTNTHEFAYGATTTSPHFGPARNPWLPERICGGSSGGSGAAVAADLASGALGTDTAGSVRIPACFCGVTGLRPSSGLVPVAGVVPVSSTFDVVGPLARTAQDCALLLEVLANRRIELGAGVRGVRIGIVETLLERAQRPVAEAVDVALRELVSLGASLEPVELPLFEKAGVIQQLVMLPEASEAHLPWLRSRLGDYGPDVRARLLAGLFLPSTAYVTGLRARRWYRDELDRVLDRIDLLAAPAMPIVAPPIGEDTVEIAGVRIPYRLALISFNSPWSLAGLPAVSVPCGFVDGLPVGFALVGRQFEDAAVLTAAHAYQGATGWHLREPLDAGPAAALYTESGFRPKGGRS